MSNLKKKIVFYKDESKVAGQRYFILINPRYIEEIDNPLTKLLKKTGYRGNDYIWMMEINDGNGDIEAHNRAKNWEERNIKRLHLALTNLWEKENYMDEMTKMEKEVLNKIKDGMKITTTEIDKMLWDKYKKEIYK